MNSFATEYVTACYTVNINSSFLFRAPVEELCLLLTPVICRQDPETHTVEYLQHHRHNLSRRTNTE